MATTEQQTVGQWLEELATSNTSDESDGKRLANILHRIGFAQAIVTCGIVYLDGKGTIEAPPASIHAVAKMLIDQASK